MNIPYKTFLTEEQIPTQYLNVRAFMKNKPAPLLNPTSYERPKDSLSESTNETSAREKWASTKVCAWVGNSSKRMGFSSCEHAVIDKLAKATKVAKNLVIVFIITVYWIWFVMPSVTPAIAARWL